ncbi:MAG: hypothetical protein OCC45_03365 [Desulfotalea sp.]
MRLLSPTKTQKAKAYKGPITKIFEPNRTDSRGDAEKLAEIRNHIIITTSIKQDTGARSTNMRHLPLRKRTQPIITVRIIKTRDRSM